MGYVVNIQRYSLGDGPGIRTTVFLKGCPLRCLWCSNPESQGFLPELAHRNSMCHHCGACLKVCPVGAISVIDGEIAIDYAKCTQCGSCVSACLYKSMTMYGSEMTVDEVVREVLKDELFYGKDGGVTLSGGEVLAQSEFAAEILERCKENGIHTAIETSGFGGDIERLLPWLDLILFDVKCVDDECHRRLTGVSNDTIFRNLEKASKSGIKTIVRYPFIPGYNTSEQQIRETAELMNRFALPEVNLMPYHAFGTAKYEALGRPYQADTHSPSTDELNSAGEIFREYGVQCSVSGHSPAPALEKDTREPRCADAMLERERRENGTH